jgi:dihydropteroate synthase
MAILNVTPDSFSDGGSLERRDTLLFAAESALKAGAHWLDVGGESTRPGAEPVPIAEELRRVIPAIETLRSAFPSIPLSVDTRKARVAEAALQAGARMVNDVSGLQFDPDMLATVARARADLVIMHCQGTPQTMQANPKYTHVVQEVLTQLLQQAAKAQQHGVATIWIDPGFGFGKTGAHNTALLQQLPAFTQTPYPVLVGLSRKSFLTLGQPIPPAERDYLTAASLWPAVQAGVGMLRLHNVTAMAPVVRWLQTMIEGNG